MSVLLAVSSGLDSSTSESLIIAVGLLVLSAALLIVEFVIISWGLLSLAAAGAAFAACAVAFSVSAWVGWIFLAACPITAFLILPWGLRRLQNTRAVPKIEITGHAGYRHHADDLNITVGSIGTLVTDALPTGRARFAGGEIDVVVEGNGLSRGARVVVQRCEGAIVFVSSLPVDDAVGAVINPTPAVVSSASSQSALPQDRP